MLRFASPMYLTIAALVMPAIVAFLWWTWIRKERAITRFVGSRLLAQLTVGVSRPRQIVKRALQVAGLSLILVALARPGWGHVEEEARLRGLDIIVAIDTSKSMLATDVAPNRLERAKLAAQDLLGLAKEDRFGLVAFAGSAFLQCPLTLDEEAFRTTLQQIDTDTIPQGGTAVAEAIDTAVAAFRKEGGGQHVLVVFSDGEDHESGAMEAAVRAGRAGVRIFTIGVGTPAGELLFTTDPFGNKVFIKDVDGNAVKSRLNETALKEIAQTGDGFYLPLQNVQTMTTLYERGLAPLPRKEGASRTLRQIQDRFQWPLAAGILLLIVEIFVRDQRRDTPSDGPATPGWAGAGRAVLVLLAAWLPFAVCASGWSANRMFEQGRYAEAYEEYRRLLAEDPGNAKLHFNAGAAAYRLGAAKDAIAHFSEASKDPDLKLQQKAFYNLGNSFAAAGESGQSDEEKLKLFEPALKSFENAVGLAPDDPRATANRDIVRRRIEEIQKRMPKQPKPNQDKNDDKNQDKENKDQQQQQQQQQQQGSKDKSRQDQGKPGDKRDQDKNEDRDQAKDGADQQKDQQQSARDDKQDSKQSPGQSKQGDDPKDGKEQQAAQAKGDKDGKKQDAASAAGSGEKPESAAEKELREAMAAGRMTQSMAEKILDGQKDKERAMLFRLVDEKPKERNRLQKNW